MNREKDILSEGSQEKLLLSFNEVATRFGVSPRSVRREVARGRLPQPVKVGHSSRFKVSEIMEYLERISAERDRQAGGAR